nr:hypothetical protein [Tanacetum cinerariifolium]
QQREGQGRGGTCGIGQQEQGGADAGALQCRAGQHQTEDRPGARRPQQAGGDADHERCPRAGSGVHARVFGQTTARGHQWPGQALG